MTDYNEQVLQQQEAIRESGMTNMFNIRNVKEIAEEMGADELVEFIDNNDADAYMEMAQKSAEKYR